MTGGGRDTPRTTRLGACTITFKWAAYAPMTARRSLPVRHVIRGRDARRSEKRIPGLSRLAEHRADMAGSVLVTTAQL